MASHEVVPVVNSDMEKKNQDAGADSNSQKSHPNAHEAGSLAIDNKRIEAMGVESAYERKVYILNRIMNEHIGMGKFQWQLFLLSGFGWFVDNLWLQGVAIILPRAKAEFNFTHIQWMTFALYVGLIIGAATWGIMADVVGRRLSFNITLALAGIFGIAAGAAPNIVGLGGLLAALGSGLGGNLPVDGMLFLEFIPGANQFLLTLLSVFWSLGQLFASLVAWAFIANYSCADGLVGADCPKSSNMGWRYFYYTMGAFTFVLFLCRFVIFRLPESPKYLVAKGRDADAVAVLKEVARRNGIELGDNIISVEILRSAAGEDTSLEKEQGTDGATGEFDVRAAMGSFKGMSFKPDLSHVKPLFAGPRVAYNTSVIFALWTLIGLAYPLYNAFLPLYLENSGVNGSSSTYTTYRNYAIISVCGVPGSIIAAWLVELPRAGRRGAMAIGTLLTGVFLFAFTAAKNEAAVLGFNCVTALTQNIMYGVLYGYTPEVFPAPHRGTGDGIASSMNRVAGLMAPIIAIYAPSSQPNTPIYVSASLFIIAAVLMCTLQIESQGRSAL